MSSFGDQFPSVWLPDLHTQVFIADFLDAFLDSKSHSRAIGTAARQPTAFRAANDKRRAEARERQTWFIEQAKAILATNPNLSSSRLADLIAARAKGTKHEGTRPRTIRRHIKMLARR
jgi:hypothetical protein